MSSPVNKEYPYGAPCNAMKQRNGEQDGGMTMKCNIKVEIETMDSEEIEHDDPHWQQLDSGLPPAAADRYVSSGLSSSHISPSKPATEAFEIANAHELFMFSRDENKTRNNGITNCRIDEKINESVNRNQTQVKPRANRRGRPRGRPRGSKISDHPYGIPLTQIYNYVQEKEIYLRNEQNTETASKGNTTDVKCERLDETSATNNKILPIDRTECSSKRSFPYEVPLTRSSVPKFEQLNINEMRDSLETQMRLRRDIMHVPNYEAGGKKTRKLCCVCFRRGITKYVHSQCVSCKVNLCFENCWGDWHSLPELRGNESQVSDIKKEIS